MGQYINDVNGEINIGGTLTKFSGVQTGGGELVRYDGTPIAGPPAGNYYRDVREPITFSVTVPIPGNSPAEADTYVNKFAGGTKFDCVDSPSGNLQMRIAGCPDAVGRQFTVSSTPQVNYQFQQNVELSFTLTENGAVGE